MKIFHLSDTHFGNDRPTHTLPQLIGAMNQFKDEFPDPNTYLVISGDVTYRGKREGYAEASSFMKETWLANGGRRENFLACPGNHDLCEGSFDAFDSFTYNVRKNNLMNYSKNSAVFLERGENVFLCVNSSHHHDKTYGLVDINFVSSLLEQNRSIIAGSKRRVAVVHHHLVGVLKDDTSTIRNAYAFLSILDDYNFEIVLHGHQHQQSELKVGTVGLQIYSARSFSYPAGGVLNGMFIIDNQDGQWRRSGWVQSLDNNAMGKAAFRELK